MKCYEDLIDQLEGACFDTYGFLHNGIIPPLVPTPDTSNREGSTKIEYKFEALIENQRGLRMFGVPLFSGKSLLPLLDPPRYLRLDGKRVKLAYDSIDNFVLPDFDWAWTWSLWYVVMMCDVDESGWAYLSFWGKRWHGHFRFGDSVRRRVWVRLRQRTLTREVFSGPFIVKSCQFDLFKHRLE